MVQRAGEVEVAVKGNLVKLTTAMRQGRAQARRFRDRVVKDFRGIDMAARNVQSRLVSVRGALVSLGAIQLGRTLTRDFIEFDQSLTRIVTLVGVSQEQVNEWRKDLLALSPAVAKGPGELADALFFITSAGQRGQLAIDTLTASAKAAAIGLGETKVVADAATSAVNAYGEENLSSARAVALLAAAVEKGKAEASEIASVLGQVVPIASATSVGFDEVAASIAAMTTLGAPAAEAATSLQAILVTIAKGGTKDAVETLDSLGLSFRALRESVREDGLLETLLLLQERIGDNEEALVKIFPNVRAIRGLLNLLGANVDNVRTIFKDLARVTGEELNPKFKTFQESVSGRIISDTVRLDKAMADMAEKTVPLLADALEEVNENLQASTIFASALLGAFFGLRKGLGGAGVGAALGGIASSIIVFRKELGLVNAEVERFNRNLEDTGFVPPGASLTVPNPITQEQQSGAAATSRLSDEQRNLLQDLKFERQQLQRTALEQEIYNNLKLAGVARTSEFGKQVEGVTRDLFQMRQAQDQLNERTQFFGEIAADAFSSLILRGESFADVLDNIIDLLVEAAIRAILLGQGPFAGFLGTAPATPGGTGGVFGGFRQKGGPVVAGMRFRVGERGPEEFIPAVPGTILPNGGLGGGVVVNVINNTSADVSVSEPRVASGQRQIDVVVDEIVGQAIRRTGSASNMAVQSQGGRQGLVGR